MMRKLVNIKYLGRYKDKTSNREVNIRRGTNPQRGTDNYYYLYRGSRIFISDKDFFNNYTKIKD